MNKPTPGDVEALMELFEKSDWKELDLRMEGFELFLSKDSAARRAGSVIAKGNSDVGRAVPADPGGHGPPYASAQAAQNAAPREAPPVPSNWLAVRAPNLGTFYRAPKPGAPPYVELGQQVVADTEVCLIEVMKLFTSVRAGVAGVVRKLVVQDGEMVEHDQVLLYIEPQ
ncbi:MAG: acetyl-CoA carboxylase biotin carboxyl carrier protein [Panacagrimonas sp.]